MDTYPEIAIFISTVAFLCATIIFGATPWYKTYPGRVLFIILANFTLVLLLITLSYWLGDYEHREVVRYIIYTLTMVNSLVILVSLLIGQLIGHNRGRFD